MAQEHCTGTRGEGGWPRYIGDEYMRYINKYGQRGNDGLFNESSLVEHQYEKERLTTIFEKIGTDEGR